MNTFERLATLAALTAAFATTNPLPAQQLVAWEKFQDDRLAEQIYCFDAPCEPDPIEVDYTFMPGQLRAAFSGFTMWRLVGFDGELVKPATEMSVRARIKASDGPIGLVGVGTDTYYWAANGSPSPGRIDLNAGRYSNPIGSAGDFAGGQEWIVQLDLYADHLEAYSWPVDDPQDIVDVVWVRDPVEPGIPVIWGNFAGEYFFKEASVTHGFMGIGGDVTRDIRVDSADIDDIMSAVNLGIQDPRYNFTSDTLIDAADVAAWVHHAAKTTFGDANLDGTFESGDLVQVFQAGTYESTQNAGWATGDWNGDRRFASDDLIVAMQDGGYQANSVTTATVPEPVAHILGILALIRLAAQRKQR